MARMQQRYLANILFNHKLACHLLRLPFAEYKHERNRPKFSAMAVMHAAF